MSSVQMARGQWCAGWRRITSQVPSKFRPLTSWATISDPICSKMSITYFSRTRPKSRPPAVLCGRSFYLFALFEICQDLRRVGVRLDLEHNLLNHAVFVNDKCGAHHAHTHLAVILFLLPYTVGLDGGQLRVGEQDKRQAMFLREFLMGGHGVLTDADHHCIDFLELIKGPAKAQA